MATPIVRTERVILGERNIAFKLYRVPRRRQVHVLVNDDGQLEVRAPWRFSAGGARSTITRARRGYWQSGRNAYY